MDPEFPVEEEEDSKEAAVSGSSSSSGEEVEETEAEQEWRKKREVRQAKKEAREEEEIGKDKSHKNLQVNMEYVKAKARQQHKNALFKQNQKRNNNKDKGVMKAHEDIRDCMGAVDDGF